MVSTIATSAMFTNILLSVIIPIGFMIVYKKRYGVSIKSFFFGVSTYAIFSLVLVYVIHSIVLGALPTGEWLTSNPIAYYIYMALVVAVCEEFGRYFVMKVLMKEEAEDPHNALMYGVGHGGLEMVVLLGLIMFNNWMYSVTINAGEQNLLFEGIEENQVAAVQYMIDQLINTSPYAYMSEFVLRIAIFIFQIAASVLVWVAVTKEEKWLFPFTIGLHFALELIYKLMKEYQVPTAIIVMVTVAYVVGVVVFTVRNIWVKYYKKVRRLSRNVAKGVLDKK